MNQSPFNYKLVELEIVSMFDATSLAKTAAYEAMRAVHIGDNNMCAIKLSDMQTQIKALQKQLKEFESKIEFIKNQV